MARPPVAMKVTTVRFGSDLLALLEREAELTGISVSQYVREAALARASAAAAARGESPFELLGGAIGEVAGDHPDAALRRAARDALAAFARLAAAETRAGTGALAAQSQQARQTARQRADRADELARDSSRLLGRDRDR
jgi:hypothetical protein